jgi:hypothetical protein
VTGRIAFLSRREYEAGQWVQQHTKPNDWFLEADFPRHYFPLQLRNPSPVASFTETDYTRPEQVRATIENLERSRVRYVLWPTWLDPVDTARGDDHLGPLRAYLRSHYRMTPTFPDGDEEVWERLEAPTGSFHTFR